MPSVGKITLFLVLLGILGLGGFNPTKFSLSGSACAGCCAYVNCYQDADGDGVAVGAASSQCAAPGCPTVPTNYVSSPSNNPATNPDCDDHNAAVGTDLAGGYASPCPAAGTQIPASGPPPTVTVTAGGVNYGNCTWTNNSGTWTANCPYGTCNFTCGPYSSCPTAQSCPIAPSGCGYAGGSVPNGSCGTTQCSALPYPSSSSCPSSCGYGGGSITGADGCSTSCPSTCACAGTCYGNSQYNVSGAGTVPFYRAYSCSNGHHFYTTSQSEYLNAYNNLGYNCDGLWWTAGYIYAYSASGSQPLYRWVYPPNNDHYYSLSSVPCCGYSLEGTAGYVMASNVTGTQYLAEWWNGYDHFYTYVTSVPQGPIGSYNYEQSMGFVYFPNNPQKVPNGSCGTTTCPAINAP